MCLNPTLEGFWPHKLISICIYYGLQMSFKGPDNFMGMVLGQSVKWCSISLYCGICVLFWVYSECMENLLLYIAPGKSNKSFSFMVAMQFSIRTLLPRCHWHHGRFKSLRLFERHTKVNTSGHIISDWLNNCALFGVCVLVWGSRYERGAPDWQV